MSKQEDHVDRVIAKWAKERPELDVSPIGVVSRLGRAAGYLDQGVAQLLRQYGLNRASWDALTALRRAGEPYRLCPTELYRELMRTSGTITHRLDRLEQQGLIRRIPNPDDGRGTLVELTAKGRRLVDRVAPGHLANEERLIRSLTKPEREQLEALLRKLLLAIETEPSAVS
jgi:DNA-binding MarR family transcriptional regulator